MQPIPLFIAFEGGEGVGKSTQLKLFFDHLKKSNWPLAPLTKEPGCPHLPLNQTIRQLLIHDCFKNPKTEPLTEVALFLADRANHLSKFVKPNLAVGKTVISDRSEGTSFAYQSLLQKILPLPTLQNMNNIFTQDFHPHLTFLIHASSDISLQRLEKARAQQSTKFDTAPKSFHDQGRSAFLQIAKANPKTWIIIDGSKTPSEIHADLWDKFQTWLENQNLNSPKSPTSKNTPS